MSHLIKINTLLGLWTVLRVVATPVPASQSNPNQLLIPQTTGKVVTEVFETQFTAMVDSFQVLLDSSYVQRNSIHLSGRYQMPLRVCMQRRLPRHQHGSDQINQKVRPVHCWSQGTVLCQSGKTLHNFFPWFEPLIQMKCCSRWRSRETSQTWTGSGSRAGFQSFLNSHVLSAGSSHTHSNSAL